MLAPKAAGLILNNINYFCRDLMASPSGWTVLPGPPGFFLDLCTHRRSHCRSPID